MYADLTNKDTTQTLAATEAMIRTFFGKLWNV